jgi:predicted ATPase
VLEGFSPTPEFPQVAEARALFEALVATEVVKATMAARRQRLTLHISLGNALIAARGYGAPETTAAFARAREAAGGLEDAPERLAAIYGLWVGGYLRGELESMREFAESFMREIDAHPRSAEAGVARRVQGVTHWFAGDFIEARRYLEQALAIFDPERDGDLTFRFGQDPGVAAMTQLALTLWPLGEVDRARRLIGQISARAEQISHVGTVAHGYLVILFEMIRGDVARAAPRVKSLADLAREHDLALRRDESIFLEAWVAWKTEGATAAVMQMRQAVALRRKKKIAAFDPLIDTCLAEAEAGMGDVATALATLGETLGHTRRTGQRWFDAEIHRTRGEVLLKQNPADPSAVEAAFAVAQQQKARSFELRAALSLAKLYQSTDRPIDAHNVLAPALEGFSPTPEFPEVAEAIGFMATLKTAGE